MPTDLKLSRTQISKIIQSGGILGSLLRKWAGLLMKVAVPLSKNIPLGIENSCCFRNWCWNSKKIHGLGTTTLIISNEEMNDILKIDQTLEDFNILLKGVNETT